MFQGALFQSSPLKRTIFFVCSDILLIELSVFLAFLLRFDAQIPRDYLIYLYFSLIILPPVVISIFFWRKIYSLNWTYIGLADLVKIMATITPAFISLAALILFFKTDNPVLNINFFSGFPRSVIFITYFLAILFLGGLRISKRFIHEIRNKTNSRDGLRVLIIGAGDAGEQLLRNILVGHKGKYCPVGFIDSDQSKIGTTIHNFRVLGGMDEIPEIVKDYRVEQVFIALPSMSSQVIRKTVALCRDAKIANIKIIPSLAELISANVSLKDIREISMEDLLGREPITFDKKLLENFIFDKAILVTGAAGSIGSELSRQIARFKPKHLIILDSEETNLFLINEELKENFSHIQISPVIANIQHKARIEDIFLKFRPEIIFHSAAYKHVPMMERHPEEAVRNNVLGTLICAESAIKSGTKNFILISTDKAINPASVMGATKRLAEMAIQHLNHMGETKFSAVRFGNVLDSRGSIVPIFREQIKKGGPIKVTHPEMRRYFMALPEATLLVIQASQMSNGGEIFALDMGKPIKIIDFAKEMIKLCGLEPDKDIPIVFTGTRPGEKMSEEILTGTEESTWHPKIFKTKIQTNFADQVFFEKLHNVFKASNEDDGHAIKQKLKELAPEYQIS